MKKLIGALALAILSACGSAPTTSAGALPGDDGKADGEGPIIPRGILHRLLVEKSAAIDDILLDRTTNKASFTLDGVPHEGTFLFWNQSSKDKTEHWWLARDENGNVVAQYILSTDADGYILLQDRGSAPPVKLRGLQYGKLSEGLLIAMDPQVAETVLSAPGTNVGGLRRMTVHMEKWLETNYQFTEAEWIAGAEYAPELQLTLSFPCEQSLVDDPAISEDDATLELIGRCTITLGGTPKATTYAMKFVSDGDSPSEWSWSMHVTTAFSHTVERVDHEGSVIILPYERDYFAGAFSIDNFAVRFRSNAF